MRPRNGHILAFPEPNYVVLKPVESHEHVLYLVTRYLSKTFTHNQAADQSFKRLVLDQSKWVQLPVAGFWDIFRPVAVQLHQKMQKNWTGPDF